MSMCFNSPDGPLKEKIALIEASEKEHPSARKATEKFGIGKTQITNILDEKLEILQAYEKKWRRKY